MKLPIAFLFAAVAAASFAAAEEPSPGAGVGLEFLPQNLKAPVGPATSDKDLKERQQREKFGGFIPAGSEPKGWDLEANSEFIAFGGLVTILPKGAILHVPDRFKSHVVTKPEGNIVIWNEFINRHRGLVSPFEVSMDEASGKAVIKPDRLEAARKSGLIVIGMLNQNPISVHQPVPAN